MLAYAQDYSGRVGINTDQPSATLDVKAKTNNGSKVLELQNSEATKLVNVLDNGKISINAPSTSLGTINIVPHKDISSDGYIVDIMSNSTSKSIFNVKNNRKVGINTNAPHTTLHIVKESSHTSGFRLEDGTQGTGKVLTSDADGNASWQNVTQIINNNVNYSVTSQVDYNILGYIPSTTATATSAPSSVSVGTKTATKLGTHTFNGNGHSYATFVSPNYLTWYEAYEMAKSMGGYLATFTTDEEWQSVEIALLNANSTFDTTSAWIGMARFEWFAGSALQPAVEMKWITGELPRHDYSAGGTNAVRKSNWFTMQYNAGGYNWDTDEEEEAYWSNGTEPNNQNGVEGFVMVWKKNDGGKSYHNGYTSYHPWNDVRADYQTTRENLKAFIVEFQQ